ncbi:histone-lysine n-methyltransferase [Sporothrix brasiliensis 5110]|uniref:Histone-lysine n-methyltransferase n=1 Tax=Sporothrix brasiliensis 5110 TaxID=1398154 RepID=A0A0C2II66_9PEZI|nr:histone-lysine n-methyltransferase [Sporothrix brasiliensis 5110]KIH88891.1 histone-lysine n-methyltransferase [Sporothrix brasiliensis 5110]
MAADAEVAPDEAPRAAPTGVRVTPIPPPTIPYTSFASQAAAGKSPTPPPGAAASRSSASPVPAAPPNPPSTLPQKRALADEDHTPAVRSPLNPESRSTPKPTGPGDDVPNVAVREKRVKKESLKKRESKAAEGGLSRATPEPKRKETAGGGGPNESTVTFSVGGGAGAGAGGGSGNETASTTTTKATASANANEGLPVRVRLAGPLRPSDFEPPASPIHRARHSVQLASGQEVEFLELFSEQPINRRGYVYESGIADPRFPSSHYFRQTEPKPHYAHFSFEDAPPNVFFDQTGLNIHGDSGFRTARANVAARQGRWYWECKVTRGILKDGDRSNGKQKETDGKKAGEPPSHGHVRVGWARREASRDAPVGYDAYGYGIRDRKGQKVHMSRPKEFLSVSQKSGSGATSGNGSGTGSGNGSTDGDDDEDIREGDVIGLEIQLPSEALHRKVVHGTYNPAVDTDDDSRHGYDHDDGPNIVRDRIPFRFQTTKTVFEKFDYVPSRELEDLANPAPTLNGASNPASVHNAAIKRQPPGAAGVPGGGEPPNPNHPVVCMRTLPGSHIRVYKNGKLRGTPWTNLLSFLPPASSTNSKIQEGARERLDDGTLGYYPAVSVFGGGAVEVNFGPDFWYPPPGENLKPKIDGSGGGEDDEDIGDVTMVDTGDDDGLSRKTVPTAPPPLTKLRPVAERYAEQIAEDIVYDIVDEVYFWMLDGGGAGGGGAVADASSSTRTARAALEGGRDASMDE